jgi:hypothetical protein
MVTAQATLPFVSLFVSTLVLVTLRSTCHALISPSQRRATQRNLHLSLQPPEVVQDSCDCRLDVVLFGLGDLRLDDHGGFQAALSGTGNKILPLLVLDPNNLSKLPVAHTLDTANIIHEAVLDLKESLQELQLDLHVSVTTLDDTLLQLNRLAEQVHIHVCDLDPVDNELGYGPYSALAQHPNVHGWTCHLREEPWNPTPGTLTDSYYTDYEKRYLTVPVQNPVPTPRTPVPVERRMSCESWSTTIPTVDAILQFIQEANSSLDPVRVREEQGTGLYGTHWGGLLHVTVGERRVLAEPYRTMLSNATK